jgi:hypothetical protein
MRLFAGKARWLRWLLLAGIAVIALLALAQAVPYGRAHTNPPVTKEPSWDSPRTRELASRACFDCHSNETRWRWYSNVAPVSWLVQRDVDGGRSAFNFSEWDKPQIHSIVRIARIGADMDGARRGASRQRGSSSSPRSSWTRTAISSRISRTRSIGSCLGSATLHAT